MRQLLPNTVDLDEGLWKIIHDFDIYFQEILYFHVHPFKNLIHSFSHSAEWLKVLVFNFSNSETVHPLWFLRHKCRLYQRSNERFHFLDRFTINQRHSLPG